MLLVNDCTSDRMPTTDTHSYADTAIEMAISSLATNMRLNVEAQMRFRSVFAVDREEAIDNVDLAFEAKLEAFHMLYDVSKTIFPYFDHPDTALVIAVRNAIHHRDHPLFHSLRSRLHHDGEVSRWRGAAFLLASHPTLHGGVVMMHHYIRLDDLDARLNPKIESPYRDTATKPERLEQRFKLIDDGLALETIRQKAKVERYPNNQVYLDLMPIFTSATARVFKAMLAAGLEFRRSDARTYMEPFTSEIEIDLSRPMFQVGRM